MTTTTLNKTTATALLATQIVATASVVPVVGSWVDVSTKLSAGVYVRFGRTTTTALTNQQNFRIELSYGAGSGTNNDQQVAIVQWTTLTATTAAASVTATAANSGQKIITVTATTFAVGDFVFAYQSGAVANSEWARVNTKTSTTALNVEDNLTRAQTTSQISSLSENFYFPIDLTAVSRIRFVCDNSRVAGVDYVIEAYMVTADSATTV